MTGSYYDVGLGKPPKRSRFRKGSSGNPKGRPDGKCNVATVLDRILHEKIVLHENGKKRIVTKLEAAIEALVTKAISGDSIAMRNLIALTRPADQTLEAAKTPSATDLIVMKTVLKRFKGPGETEDDEDQ